MVRARRRPLALLAACLGLAAVAGCAAAGSTRPAGTAAASARPPEERSSEDPERQAEVILEESGERTYEGAEKSIPT